MPMTAILKVSIRVAYYVTMIVQGIQHLSVGEQQKYVRVRVLITMQCPPQTSRVCWQVQPYRYDRSEVITLAIICTLCCHPGGRVPDSNFGMLWHALACFGTNKRLLSQVPSNKVCDITSGRLTLSLLLTEIGSRPPPLILWKLDFSQM
jgi:hypothetical protein